MPLDFDKKKEETMTHKNDSNIPDWILEEINRNGFYSVPKMIENLVNTTMKAQREEKTHILPIGAV